MLIIQLVLSINQGPNSVEGMDIHSRRVKPNDTICNDPTITTTKRHATGKK
jgi:hypothetical protein